MKIKINFVKLRNLKVIDSLMKFIVLNLLVRYWLKDNSYKLMKFYEFMKIYALIKSYDFMEFH